MEKYKADAEIKVQAGVDECCIDIEVCQECTQKRKEKELQSLREFVEQEVHFTGLVPQGRRGTEKPKTGTVCGCIRLVAWNPVCGW